MKLRRRSPLRLRAGRRLVLVLAAATLAWLASPAQAANCQVVAHTVGELQSAVRAGSLLFQTLESSGAEIALVARIGSDQSKRGIRFTHVGLSWRDHPAGRWHFVHLLNHCGEPTSDLFDDGPVDFFLERPFRYDAWVVIPKPLLQRRLAELLRCGVDRDVHTRAYSAIANPFATRYQNSNQWVLELIALALDDVEAATTRERAQSILRSRGYVAERVRLGFFGRVGARRMENVSLRDHSRRELRDGGYRYVSVKSIVGFLKSLDLVDRELELSERGSP